MRVDIAGAGPAGCAAAIVLGRANVDVRVWSRPGRNPRASETLNPGVYQLLTSIEAASALDGAHRSWAGWEVGRSRFDARLLTIATAQGVEVLQQAHSGTPEPGRWLLDATGHHRLLARSMKLDERTAGTPVVVWRGVVSGYRQPDAQRFERDANGWTWLAPEPDGRCTWTRVGQRQPPAPLAGLPVVVPPSGRLTQCSLVRPCVGENWMLVGDAAASTKPISGQGVLTALWSGIRAARTLLAIRDEPQLRRLRLAHYDDAVTRNWEEQCRVIRSMARPARAASSRVMKKPDRAR